MIQLLVMSSTPEWEFEEWFCETHGTQKLPITSDILECDECIEDDYSEDSTGDLEIEPPDGGFVL